MHIIYLNYIKIFVTAVSAHLLFEIIVQFISLQSFSYLLMLCLMECVETSPHLTVLRRYLCGSLIEGKEPSVDQSDLSILYTVENNTRMYPKVFGLATWRENCKWYSFCQ